MSEQNTVSGRPPAPGELVVLRPEDPTTLTARPRSVLEDRPRSVLEEERDFFLRSLRDLEAEHDAGDIDDADHAALKDDYTVRAAAVIRQLAGDPPARRPEVAAPTSETDASSVPSASSGRPGRARRWRWVAAVAVAVIAGSVAGWAVTSASGARLPGQTVSGAPVGAAKIAQLLLQAQKAAATGDAVTALKDCRTILAENPDQAQALAEEGWLLAQTRRPGLQTQALGDLTRAVNLAPDDQTAHLYRGIVLVDVGRQADAVGDLQWYLDHGPDPQVKPRVETALAQARTGVGGPP
ncbi:MAG: hypothetical protein M3063_12720 [Actinomycetota bacterium]|nr:hypothetical protein [Actinomycetota bacterium]